MADEIVYVTVAADVVETVDVASFIPEPLVVDVLVNEIFDGFSYVSNTEPLTPVNGQTWYNPDTGQSKVWHLTEWFIFPEVGVPSGTIIQGGWLVAPFGCAFLNGQTLVDGALDYPTLAIQYPSWVSGDDLVLPDIAGFTLISTNGTAGTTPITSNAKTVTITANNLPTHTHSSGTLANGNDSPGHVHYTGASHGSIGGWTGTVVTGIQSASHTHTPVYGSISGNVGTGTGGNLGNFTVGSGATYGFTGTTNQVNAQSASHTHPVSGYTTGAHQNHSHTISGNTGNNTTTATPLPYNTTPAHMLIKTAVKL